MDKEAPTGRGPPGPEPAIPAGTPAENLTTEETTMLATLNLLNPATGQLASPKAFAKTIAVLAQKIRLQTVEMSHEKNDSIEVSRNAKGEHAWKIKVYLAADRGYAPSLQLIEQINDSLVLRYIPTADRRVEP